MENTKKLKNDLRTEYKLRRRSISSEQKKELDNAICEQISSLACFRFADTILTYSPIGTEIDITPITLEALKKGKRVAYPVCDISSSTMVYRYISDISELSRGNYSIPEPSDDAPEFSGAENALCIVPALAFDSEGFRLGYGKGYYDRFLKSFRGTSLGAVYADLLTDILPRGYYDVPVEVLVTERGSIITDAGRKKIASFQ